MFFTGFADEAADDLPGQIEATRQLGWKHIELRGIGGKNLAALTDAEFDQCRRQLSDAAIQVNCWLTVATSVSSYHPSNGSRSG